MSKKYDKFLKNKSWLHQKYWDDGLTPREISEIVGCCREAVWYALKRHGIAFRKASEAHKGDKHSEATKQKISESHKGKNNPFYGKHHTQATKLKMAKAGIGVHPSEETRQKRSKDKHWNWKGGVTKERKRLCSSTEGREWRRHVFERDGYTCQVCGRGGGMLCAHHIKPFATYHDLRFVLDNGITLCVDCHVPTYGKELIYAKYFISIIRKENVTKV